MPTARQMEGDRRLAGMRRAHEDGGGLTDLHGGAVNRKNPGLGSQDNADEVLDQELRRDQLRV